MKEKVLITGGLGYVGGRVAQALKTAGYSLRLSTRKKDKKRLDWLPEAEVVAGSMMSDADLNSWCNGVSTVVHLAAMNEQDGKLDPLGAIEVNVSATVKLMEAAKRAGVKKFIYFSTMHVYGSPLQGVITENTVTNPQTPYSITHETAEKFLLESTKKDGISVTVLRPSNGFGVPAHMDVNTWMLIVNDLCYQAVATKHMVMRSSGLQWRNFVPLSDVANSVVHLLQQPVEKTDGQIFNIGMDCSMRVIDVVDRIALCYESLFGVRPEVERPEPLDGEIFPRVDFKIDKILKTGFVLSGNVDEEIKATLKLCRDNLTKVNLKSQVNADTKKTVTFNLKQLNVTDKTKPMITMAMPVYNGSLFLREAIESILKQTFTDFEFLIIDNCSTDDSVEIIKSYQDPRIRLVRNEINMGIAYSRNKGMELAKGKYLAWMDCDDTSEANRLEIQYAYMEEHQEISLSGAWMRTLGYKNRVWKYPLAPEDLRCELLFGDPIASPTVIMRCDDVRDSNIRYYSPYGTEDYDILVQFALQGKKIGNISELLVNYRVHNNQTSNSFREKQLEYTGIIQCAQLPLLRIYPSLREKIVHYQIGVCRYHSTQEFVREADAWLRKLREANHKVAYYQKKAFDNILRLYWMKMYNALRRTGLREWIEQYHQQSLWT